MDIAELSDIQSESGIIGTLIAHPEYIEHTEFLQPRYFYSPENQLIFWAISDLAKDGIQTMDAYNLSNKLKSNKAVQKNLEKFNLPSVQEWIERYRIVQRDSLEEYKTLAEDVTTLAFKRELVKSLDSLRQSCFKRDTNLTELSNNVYGQLDQLTQKFVQSEEIKTLGDELDDIWAEIESRRTTDGIYGLPSKYPSFLPYFTYEPGELVLIHAKYKQGKSAFLMNEAVHKLRNGVPVLVVDSEMSTRQYTERLLAHISGVSNKKIKNGTYNAEEKQQVQEAFEWLKRQNFVHIYDPGMTMDKLYSICKMLKRKIGLSFVVYDYLKDNSGSSSEIYNALGAKCDFLKNKIAGELDMPVLSAAQLNRAGDIADSYKINMYLSVAIKWGYKTQEMQVRDGIECGNMYAKIYINRLGEQMQEDDDSDYIDFLFDGDTMTVEEAQQHVRADNF